MVNETIRNVSAFARETSQFALLFFALGPAADNNQPIARFVKLDTSQVDARNDLF